MAIGLVLVHDEVPGGARPRSARCARRWPSRAPAVRVTTFLPGGPPIPEPADVGVLAVLGSPAAADDDALPWLGPERAYLTRCVELGVPVLGVCFGAQLLSRVLGGRVGRAARSERGFVSLTSAAPDELPHGEWLQFHDDACTLPPGAELLAANAVGVQAFQYGRHLGVQFHPEITPTAFAAWVDSWRVAAAGCGRGEHRPARTDGRGHRPGRRRGGRVPGSGAPLGTPRPAPPT